MQSRTICSQAVRSLAVDQIESANSGHPGVALGFADVVTVLWRYHMRFDLNPGGYVAIGLYFRMDMHRVILCRFTYVRFSSRAQRFRRFSLYSHTPGHPERDARLGVDMTTGPLGQGFANGVGMAMATLFGS